MTAKCNAPTVVEHALLGTALRSLLLLLLFDLGGLRFDFACTGERAVNYMEFAGGSMSKGLFSESGGSNDLFPCCLEVGVSDDVGGDEKDWYYTAVTEKGIVFELR